MRLSVVAPYWIALALTDTVSAQPTYSKDVAPILQAKCQQCHQDGAVAPFALKHYDSAVQWARDIQNSLMTGQMPPWKPVPGYGDFTNSRALPAPIAPTGEWLGQPDIVLQMVYRCLVIPSGLTDTNDEIN